MRGRQHLTDQRPPLRVSLLPADVYTYLLVGKYV